MTRDPAVGNKRSPPNDTPDTFDDECQGRGKEAGASGQKLDQAEDDEIETLLELPSQNDGGSCWSRRWKTHKRKLLNDEAKMQEVMTNDNSRFAQFVDSLAKGLPEETGK
jgi:hypothetical protein